MHFKILLFTAALWTLVAAGTIPAPPTVPVEPVEEKCPCRCG